MKVVGLVEFYLTSADMNRNEIIRWLLYMKNTILLISHDIQHFH